MSSGTCCDWFSSPNTKIVTAALTSLLVAAAKKVLKNPVSVHVVCELKRQRSFFGASTNPHWTGVVRTANGCDAVLLGQSVGTALVKQLVASVPLRDGEPVARLVCSSI